MINTTLVVKTERIGRISTRVELIGSLAVEVVLVLGSNLLLRAYAKFYAQRDGAEGFVKEFAAA